MAVDGQHIYWANYGGGTIGRANLDGTGVNQSFITGANAPVRGGGRRPAHLLDQLDGTIGRANLDGSGVNQSFITGANAAQGVAVDGQHIYWANNATTRSGGRTSTAPGSTRASSPAPATRSGWRWIR